MMTRKTFTVMLLMLASVASALARGSGHFTTKGDCLLDANGKKFVIVGMNNPHAWFGERAYQALDYIQETGSNTIRIVWQTSGKDAELERIISRCIELKMVPMVELHDVTGNTSKDRLVAMAQWYSRPERVAMLKKYEKYLLLNIANEWGDNAMTSQYWFDAYKAAVSVMRDAGYLATLVVDAPGWGQNIAPFLEKGQELIDSDPMNNILLSVHMYGSWNSPEKIEKDLKSAKEKKLPLIVGEFGYNYKDGDNNLGCKADHKTILSTCAALGYGYMPWSWTGNNRENQWLDIVDPSDWKTLTWWGNEVVNGKYGITASARRCRVFGKK